MFEMRSKQRYDVEQVLAAEGESAAEGLGGREHNAHDSPGEEPELVLPREFRVDEQKGEPAQQGANDKAEEELLVGARGRGLRRTKGRGAHMLCPGMAWQGRETHEGDECGSFRVIVLPGLRFARRGHRRCWDQEKNNTLLEM